MSCLYVIGSSVQGEPEEVVERLLKPGRIVKVDREKYRFRELGGPYVHISDKERGIQRFAPSIASTITEGSKEKYWALLGWWGKRRFMVRMMGDGCTVDVEAPSEVAEPWYGRGRGSNQDVATGIIPPGIVRMPGWPHLEPEPIESAWVSVWGGRCESVGVHTRGYSLSWTPVELWPELVAAVVAVELGGLRPKEEPQWW